jgi:hypothetical protein
MPEPSQLSAGSEAAAGARVVIRHAAAAFRQLLAVRQTQHDAVVGVHHLDLEAFAALAASAAAWPGGVDARTEAGQNADAPVARCMPLR